MGVELEKLVSAAETRGRCTGCARMG